MSLTSHHGIAPEAAPDSTPRNLEMGESGHKLLLVCSSGGHLLQLYSLRTAWEGMERFWVCFPTTDAKSILAGERVVWAFHPTNRNIPNLLRNLWLAWRVVRRERPSVIITTGAGVAVPFCYVGRMFGAHVIVIESFARVEDLSLTSKLIAPVANLFLVQWPALLKLHRKARYEGKVY